MLIFSLNKKQTLANTIKKSKTAIATSLLVVLTACGSDNDPVVETPPPEPIEYNYSVTVTNLTYAQPLSPLAVVLHNNTKMWMIGEPSTPALEKLAEGW